MINNYFHNLTESVIIISLFCILYVAVFQREITFKQNRLFLLIGLLLSIVMPFVDFSYPQNLMGISAIQLDSITVMPDDISISSEASTYNLYGILLSIYALGMGIFIIRFIYQIIKISTFFGSAQIDIQNEIKLVYTNKIHSAFSFLSFVFIDKKTENSKDLEVVIKHETAHIKQKHSVDLLLFELLLIIQWFNPLVWLYGKKIKENHEYLVDKALINRGMQTEKYQQILLSTYEYFNFDLINNFNHSLTLKRLIMMTKNKSKKTAIVKLIAIVPILLLSVYLVSCTKEEQALCSKEPGSTEDVVVMAYGEKNKGKTKAIESGEEIFTNNKSLIGKDREGIFFSVDEVPKFEGGGLALRNFIARNVTYPKEARQNGIEGKVYVRFVVRDDGCVDKATVARSIHPLLDQEAIRVVQSLPKWKPGKQSGKPVNVWYTVPINFRLN